jgi:hypothetical protein
MPASLRDYVFFVPGRDTLSRQLEEALHRQGLVVLPRLRGGGPPTAAVIHFTMRAPGAGTATVVHVRLADTRTGAIVGAATLAPDSLPAGHPWTEAVIDSLGLRRGTIR